MVFSNESALPIRCAKYWSFSFSISPSNEYSGLISFSIGWIDLLAVQGTLKSLLQHHNLKASILLHSAFFMVQFSRHTWLLEKPWHWLYVYSKLMSQLFNVLSRFVIAFFPRSKHLLISWLRSLSTVILEPKKIKICHCFHFFPICSICHKVMGLDGMVLVFLMLSFKPAFSLSSFCTI